MSADINIVEFNYSFLKKLERDRNLTTSNVKLKFTGFLKPSTYTQLYATTDGIGKTYPQIKLSKEARKCLYGDFSKIEEVVITNKNFPFFNEFHVYNITGTIRIVDKVRFNGLNKDFYDKEIQRYKKLLVDIFSKYLGAWNEYKKMMDDCYVVNCYVDKYYNCPENEEDYRETPPIVYPDLFIEAGENAGYLSPYIYGGQDYQTVGATHAEFNGATRLWTCNNSNLTFDDPTKLNPIVSEVVSTAPFAINTYQLTLTVTYPWGPVISDSKSIRFRGFSNAKSAWIGRRFLYE